MNMANDFFILPAENLHFHENVPNKLHKHFIKNQKSSKSQIHGLV